MADTDPITQDEMVAMFGEEMPMIAVKLVWSAPGTMTIGEVRAKLRAIAAKPLPTLLERLRCEAVSLSGDYGDLFGKAADEIERLRALDEADHPRARMPE